jgi:Na+/phosphate symporter
MNFGRCVWQEKSRRRGSLPNFRAAQWTVVARPSRRAVRQGRDSAAEYEIEMMDQRRSSEFEAQLRYLGKRFERRNQTLRHAVRSRRPSDEEHRRLEGIRAFSLNLESGGDVIERNILPLAARQMKRGVELSDEPEREIEATFQAARNNLGATASIFMTGDPRAARALIEQKREFRRREADAIRARLAPSCGRATEGRRCLSTRSASPSSGAQAHY